MRENLSDGPCCRSTTAAAGVKANCTHRLPALNLEPDRRRCQTWLEATRSQVRLQHNDPCLSTSDSSRLSFGIMTKPSNRVPPAAGPCDQRPPEGACRQPDRRTGFPVPAHRRLLAGLPRLHKPGGGFRPGTPDRGLRHRRGLPRPPRKLMGFDTTSHPPPSVRL